MKVLVTGGLGFLGRAVVANLTDHGHQVVALTHSRAAGLGSLELVRADLRDREGLRAAVGPLEVDAVCHLAALTSVRDSFVDPIGYFDTNVTGTANLLCALEGAPTRVVFTSTNAVYGSTRAGQLGEDLEPRPENPYAASKVAAEQLLRYHAGTGAIGATVLRCFNIAGAVDGYGDPDTTRIIPATLRAAAGLIPHVSMNGDGSAVREFTHVLDIAEAVRLALEATEPGRHEVFNVGTGHGVSMAEVIEVAEKVTGRTIPVEHRPPAREAHTLIADAGLIRVSLGWESTQSSPERILQDAWKALPKAI